MIAESVGKDLVRLRTRFSVVIPAHNEEKVVARCLNALMADLEKGEAEIILVANGCTDKTVEIVREYGDLVRIVEIPEASKHSALNAGDAVATVFPRGYLDADVTVSAAAIRAVADELGRFGVLAGAPQAIINFDGASAVVRSFYRIWCKLPWFTDEPIGSGLYMLSAAGHDRLGSFPDITNDDQFVHDLFRLGERRSVKSHRFVIVPPRTLGGLIRRRARTLGGQRELAQRFGAFSGQSSGGFLIDLLCREPTCLFDVVTFIGITMVAKLLAKRKQLLGDRSWERDETSRTYLRSGLNGGPYA